MTYRAYKNWAALKHAAQRLPSGETIGALGLDAGFASAAHFCRRSRPAFGLAPSEALHVVS